MLYYCNNCGHRFNDPAGRLDGKRLNAVCPKCFNDDYDSLPRCIICHKTTDEVGLLAFSSTCGDCAEALRKKVKALHEANLTADEQEAFSDLYADLTEINRI